MNPRLLQIQQEFLKRWETMERAQRLLAIAIVVLAIAALVGVSIWSGMPDYAVAYSGLSETDAAAIVKKLKETNVPYQLADGGATIKVPSAQVYEVRLSTASAGLPQGGVVGFELFNNPSLAMTDFTQQLNYQRALEGELARTIGAIAAVDSARVHIVIPQPTLYAQEKKTPTASVVLKLKPGLRLNAGQVQAITNLIAGSVEGLRPEAITLVDTQGNMLSSGLAGGSDGDLKVTQTQLAAQRDYEQQAASAVEAMLARVLGPNKAVVRVSATMGWDKLETSTESYAPAGTTGSMIRSAHVLSETYGAGAAPGGIPGVSSNVPTYQSVVSGTAGATGSPYQRLESTTNYDLSRVTSKRVAMPGKVERLSVSVIVDGVTDAAKLTALKESITAAVGADATRGDIVSVSSAAFDRSYYDQETKSMDDAHQQELIFNIGKAVLLGLAALGVFFFMRRTFMSLAPARMPAPVIIEKSDAPLLAGASGGPGAAISEPAFSAAALNPSNTRRDQLQAQLNHLARTRPGAVAEVIEQWLKEDAK
ncbi:MAG: flagellar M-ring protein FliF [Chloroflexi bacterium]|nr:flagellar M-ring protein FliF [Chloroflexota bacterium]